MYEQKQKFIEELPTTAHVFLFGLLLVGVGFGLDSLGYPVESGITTALALVILVLVVLAQGLIWVLSVLD
jgi:hypothetical protein